MTKKILLSDWLTHAVSDPDKEGGCTAFVMHHTIAGGKKGDFVHKIARGSSEWDLKKVEEVFDAKAAMFVQEKNGRQVFRVYPFYGGRGESEGYFEFPKERSEEGVGSLTEEPDVRGQTSQQMRHNEALGALYVSGINQLMGHMLEHNRQLADEATHLRRDNQQNFETMKGMVLQMESHAHEMRMREMEFERTSVFFRKASELAAPLLNTVTGREIIPQSFADTQLLEAIVSHMAAQQDGTGNGDALYQMLGTFPQHIQVSMMARASEIMKKKRLEREEIAKMNPFRDPAADAAGEITGKSFEQQSGNLHAAASGDVWASLAHGANGANGTNGTNGSA
jgi:hypothetical protein